MIKSWLTFSKGGKIEPMELGHILNSDQTRQELDEILKETAKIKTLWQINSGKVFLRTVLKYKDIVLLFNQPSTRTRTKFERAAKRLGADVTIITEVAYTSVVKGEDWLDTIKTHAEGGADLIVIRHPQNFAPHRAAAYCKRYGFKTKIINAGDGNNLHPTQAITDLFTIWEHFGERFGKETLEIAIGADVKNARVLHSLVMGLAQYPVKVTLVSWQKPKTFLMPRKYLQPLAGKFQEVKRLTQKKKFDVIYWVRHQTEHVPENLQEKLRKKYNQDFYITPSLLGDHLKKDGIFMYPGPRDGEIDKRIDLDPRVRGGAQVENGIFTSMALLKMMLNPRFYIPKPSEI